MQSITQSIIHGTAITPGIIITQHIIATMQHICMHPIIICQQSCIMSIPLIEIIMLCPLMFCIHIECNISGTHMTMFPIMTIISRIIIPIGPMRWCIGIVPQELSIIGGTYITEPSVIRFIPIPIGRYMSESIMLGIIS